MPPTGLVYVSDSEPGISRFRKGKEFTFVMPNGEPVECEKEKTRINALAIPPAYENVWICIKDNGHLQATGLDDRNRKQYRYHTEWSEYRNLKKFDQLKDFGESLPRLRRAMNRDLKSEIGSREFTLSALVKLLDHSALRVGTKAYAKENGTYGATTLLGRHMKLEDETIRLRYSAKGGKRIQRTLRHKKLHKILETVSDLPGKELFTYRSIQGDFIPVDSSALNAYLADISGLENISAKTFRTWAGTLSAFREARKIIEDGEVPTIKAITKAASKTLFNTPTICRNSYVHPRIIEIAQDEDEVYKDFQSVIKKDKTRNGLKLDEVRLIDFLEA